MKQLVSTCYTRFSWSWAPLSRRAGAVAAWEFCRGALHGRGTECRPRLPGGRRQYPILFRPGQPAKASVANGAAGGSVWAEPAADHDGRAGDGRAGRSVPGELPAGELGPDTGGRRAAVRGGGFAPAGRGDGWPKPTACPSQRAAAILRSAGLARSGGRRRGGRPQRRRLRRIDRGL